MVILRKIGDVVKKLVNDVMNKFARDKAITNKQVEHFLDDNNKSVNYNPMLFKPVTKMFGLFGFGKSKSSETKAVGTVEKIEAKKAPDFPIEYRFVMACLNYLIDYVKSDIVGKNGVKLEVFVKFFEGGRIPNLVLDVYRPDELAANRKRFSEKSNQDWSPVIKLYGGLIYLCFDWDKDYWFVIDNRRGSTEEWALNRAMFRDFLYSLCDWKSTPALHQALYDICNNSGADKVVIDSVLNFVAIQASVIKNAEIQGFPAKK